MASDPGVSAERTELSRSRTRMTVLVAVLSAAHLAVDADPGRWFELMIGVIGFAVAASASPVVFLRPPRRDGLGLLLTAVSVSVVSAVAAATR